MLKNNSLYLSIKYIISLMRFSKSIPSHIKVTDSTYIGLNGDKLPLKIIKSRNTLNRTLIIFPGASPTAEEHPGLLFLSSVLANIGFNIYIPRMPLLKKLNISEDNVNWFAHGYSELIKRDDIQGTRISCMGVSFGGAILLKASLNKLMLASPPHSILTYGTYYDVRKSMDFLIHGTINIKGKDIAIQPHEWGLVVFMHNFLHTVDVGFDTTNLEKILALRIQDMNVDKDLENLSAYDRKIIDDILNSKISNEVNKIIDVIFKERIDLLDDISPKNWCEQVKSKVYVMHGANDNMVPYTQSVDLANHLVDSELFISYLYEHNEISPNRSFFYKIKELLRIVSYMRGYIKYHEN